MQKACPQLARKEYTKAKAKQVSKPKPMGTRINRRPTRKEARKPAKQPARTSQAKAKVGKAKDQASGSNASLAKDKRTEEPKAGPCPA